MLTRKRRHELDLENTGTKNKKQKVTHFEDLNEYPWINRQDRWPLKEIVNVLTLSKSEGDQKWWILGQDSRGYLFSRWIEDEEGVDASAMKGVHDSFSQVLNVLFARLWTLDYLVSDTNLLKPVVRVIDEYLGVEMTKLVAPRETIYKETWTDEDCRIASFNWGMYGR